MTEEGTGKETGEETGGGSDELRHLPLRPLWLCRHDGQPWPCGAARANLSREYAHDRLALCVYLGLSLAEAYLDLTRLHPDTAPGPGALTDRFLGWVRSVRSTAIGRDLPEAPGSDL
ncbi:hypothetical protein [Plantactinospora sonchi]|uniref:Uncharacterized protein n=1 Tax=Plantactinospora sonchi TaxID=1544735 RepID=A0ABU7RVC4_9ACTN